MMDGQTLLVTVHVASAPYDLQVPAEVVLADLIPLLLTALDLPTQTVANWRMGRPFALAPFPLTQTLLAAGVVDGEEIVLQEIAAWHEQHTMPYTMAKSAVPGTNRWEI